MTRPWIGWILGPSAWALHLSLSYALVPWICGAPSALWLHALTAVALLVALTGVALAWQSWRHAAEPRAAFLAVTGLMLSALFALLVLSQGVPNFVLGACLR